MRNWEVGAIGEEVVEALVEDAIAPSSLKLAVDSESEEQIPEPGGVQDVRVEQRDWA